MGEDDKRRELEERISKAQSIEEVKAMLAENGVEMSDEQAELLRILAQQLYDPSSAELSMDELQAVAGGVTNRDWEVQGCAATVEDGSSCWFTDGGCSSLNIRYTNYPIGYCPSCGEYGVIYDRREIVEELCGPMTVAWRRYLRCHYCGFEYTDIR